MESKILFLVRHGETESASSLRYPDGDRPLSAEGEGKIEGLADFLHRCGVAPNLILHSPLLRTSQTAKLIAGKLHSPLRSLDLLAEDAMPERWHAELSTLFNNCNALMIVGHEPGLIAFLGAVTGIPPYTVAIERGTSIQIELSEHTPKLRGQVRAIIPANLLVP